MFTIDFSIHCNFFILLSIWLIICRSNEFFFCTNQNVSARKIGCTSEVLLARGRPTSIACAIFPSLLTAFTNFRHLIMILFIRNNITRSLIIFGIDKINVSYYLSSNILALLSKSHCRSIMLNTKVYCFQSILLNTKQF